MTNVVNGKVYVGMQYGIDYLDENEEVILTVEFGSEDEAAAYNEKILADYSLWPDTATSTFPWERRVYRDAIYGYDYGPGSVQRIWGKGNCPRGTYQFRG